MRLRGAVIPVLVRVVGRVETAVRQARVRPERELPGADRLVQEFGRFLEQSLNYSD